MRRQELIYNQVDGVARNRDILNISTSSDICVFEAPLLSISGASKIVTGTTNGLRSISLDTTEISLQFSATPSPSLSYDTNFSYKLYLFSELSNTFSPNATINSESIAYSAFSGTNTFVSSIPTSGLTIDGEYLIKVSYDYKVCTDILGKIGIRNTSSTNTLTGSYGNYDLANDYYMAIVYSASTPIFDLSPQSDSPVGSVNVFSIQPSGETAVTIVGGFNGEPVVALNGLVLAEEMDYYISGDTIFLLGETYPDDIITIFYVGVGSQNGLNGNSYQIQYAILSGSTNSQNNETFFYNIDSSKYEMFLPSEPTSDSEILVSLNGVVLANGIDYYQSISNPKRIIFEGNLFVGDIVTVVYNSRATYVNNITSNLVNIYWTIPNPPQKNNGLFTLELATDNAFSNIIYSAQTAYIVGGKLYSAPLELNGPLGTKFYYRVKNEKSYQMINGEIGTSIAYSETVPIIIQSNTLNNY